MKGLPPGGAFFSAEALLKYSVQRDRWRSLPAFQSVRQPRGGDAKLQAPADSQQAPPAPADATQPSPEGTSLQQDSPSIDTAAPATFLRTAKRASSPSQESAGSDVRPQLGEGSPPISHFEFCSLGSSPQQAI